MTALSEALLTAQRGALAALAKDYVRGKIDLDDVHEHAKAMGCADGSDLDLWSHALDTLRVFGAEPSANGAAAKPPAEDEPASEAQWKLLRKLADERGVVAPGEPLTKAQASAAISALKAGTYTSEPF